METTARYLRPLPDGQTPFTYAYKPAHETRLVLYPLKNERVAIDDVRGVWDSTSVNKPSLNEDGLELVVGIALGRGLDNSRGDYDDDGKVEAVYYPQVTELLKNLIEADGKRKVKKTVVFDHTIRRRKDLGAKIKGNSANGVSVNPKEREPVGSVHGDYTVKSGPQRVRDLVGGEEAEKLLKENRWAIVNIWKPLKGPIYDAPLAFVAPGTFEPEKDFLPHRLIYPDRVGETLAIKHNPAHRFVYYSQMTPDCAWAFKTYDSQTGVEKVAPHTGIDEPNPEVRKLQPTSGKGRESIEVRILVFWDDVEKAKL